MAIDTIMLTPSNCEPKSSLQRHDNCDDDYGMMKMKEEKRKKMDPLEKENHPWAFSQQFINLYLWIYLFTWFDPKCFLCSYICNNLMTVL